MLYSFSLIPIRDIKKQKAHVASVLIQPLISNLSAAILSATIRHNGAPIIQLSSGAAFTYDVALHVWTKASEARWAEGSDAWEGRQRATANRGPSGARGIVASLEANISDLELNNGEQRGNTTPWWNVALTLGHLETRLHAARLLDSPSEYKTNLLQYAKKLSEEGFRGKAEELLKELCGPLYWYVSALIVMGHHLTSFAGSLGEMIHGVQPSWACKRGNY